MTYYRLEPSSDSTVIGKTFPQSQEINSELSVRDPLNLISVGGKFPDNIYIPELILHPKAKITDNISASVISQRLVISDKLKNIVAKYRQRSLEFGATNLIANGIKIPYWIMNGYKMDYQYIDFSRSTIVKRRSSKDKTIIDIQSAAGFEVAVEALINGPEPVWIEKMVLVDHIPDDIFFIDKVTGSNYYLSEKIKNEIEAAECTGINFVKVE